MVTGMLALITVLALLLALNLIVAMATHPIRFLVAATRVLLFIVGITMAAAALTSFGITSTPPPPHAVEQAWTVSLVAFAAWGLTFILPVAIRMLTGSRHERQPG